MYFLGNAVVGWILVLELLLFFLEKLSIVSTMFVQIDTYHCHFFFIFYPLIITVLAMLKCISLAHLELNLQPPNAQCSSTPWDSPAGRSHVDVLGSELFQLCTPG